MLLHRIAITNVKSFLDRQEINLEEKVTILLGPNGGGKTNLLDVAVTMLRRFLMVAPTFDRQPTSEDPDMWAVNYNHALDEMPVERHYFGGGLPQRIEVLISPSQDDINAMARLQRDADQLRAQSPRRFTSDPWAVAKNWRPGEMQAGERFDFVWNGSGVENPTIERAQWFLDYMKLFELDNHVRSLVQWEPLRVPMLYLPVGRGSSITSEVKLSEYNDAHVKRRFDTTRSHSADTLMTLAIGRLSQRHRQLENDENTSAREKFYSEDNNVRLTAALSGLGYSWELVCRDINTNTYDIVLKKEGVAFRFQAASSGERQLLTYLFAIYALNVRDALIVVDEPELHLHPRWQKSLLKLFEQLSDDTGNRFLLATHSPTFIAPGSIGYVCRVYNDGKNSHIQQIDKTALPPAKGLAHTINSQNNERIFFADRVLLVEGVSDQMVVERLIANRLSKSPIQRGRIVEVVAVGGKGLFSTYQKVLTAFSVPTYIMADLDYLKQIGSSGVKALFKTSASRIKRDVLDNSSSLDGDALVKEIDNAIASGDWTDASAVWEYIKASRLSSRSDWKAEESQLVDLDIKRLAKDNIFILREGEIEDYLPSGHKQKDIETLIQFVGSASFEHDLRNKKELDDVVDALLGS